MPHKPNQLRIIAGKWRSRVIAFPDIADIRPTPDRVRETLFNWLQMRIEGAQCLDLFAGSGALGFEALSRGASHVTFVDKHADIITHLETQGKKLEAENFECARVDTLAFISKPAVQAFDVVFLDPPFDQNLSEVCLKALVENHWLAPGALIYCEQSSPLEALQLPSGLSLTRHKRTSEVHYGLIELQ
jgi:16S rRNA (guanine966-N2)-methyltransferase